MSEEQAPEIQINVKGPSELKLQISITTDKTVLELKQAIAAKSDVEAERQRLIYSGRVLKDEDLLSVYKIQSGHTIHMVKGVNRSGGSSSTSTTTPAQLPTMQTGQNVHDPLTQLNSHLGFGAMAGLNPFADMGLNQNDPNMMQNMMNSPQFFEQMANMMRNPAILDQVIAMNPQLAAMGPQVRAAFQDESFQRILSNPDSLRQMMQMSAAMRGSGMGGPFGANPFGGPGGFPAPGDPNNASSNASPTSPPGQVPPMNPFNFFSALAGANPGAAGTTPGSGTTPPSTTTPPAGSAPPNPFGFDPSLMMGMGGQGIGGPFGGLGGFGPFGGASATPSDTRPPEERYQNQLQQLQEMGFSNAVQNVRALLATAGNVQAAIEYILSGGGL